MREIKFRAWDIEEKRMYYANNGWGFYSKHDSLSFELEGIPSTHRSEELDEDDLMLMQFTGLKDKNGKEIYEGDVIRTSDPRQNELKVLPVEWMSVGWTPLLYLSRGYGTENQSMYVEVIGNIYENPELLKN